MKNIEGFINCNMVDMSYLKPLMPNFGAHFEPNFSSYFFTSVNYMLIWDNLVEV